MARAFTGPTEERRSTECWAKEESGLMRRRCSTSPRSGRSLLLRLLRSLLRGGGDLGDLGAEALDVGEPGGGVLHVAAGAGGVPGAVEAGEATVDDGALAVLVVVGGDQVAGGAVDQRLHARAGLDGGDGDALEEVLQAGGEEVPARHADLLL